MNTSIVWMCREGFEGEARQEIEMWAQSQNIGGKSECKAGYGFFHPDDEDFCANKFDEKNWRDWIFLRSVWLAQGPIALDDKDRATPLANMAVCIDDCYSEVMIEYPDTNDGKMVTGFSKRFLEPFERKLSEYNIVKQNNAAQLRLFMFDLEKAWIGFTHSKLQSPWPMGIPRLRFPAEAPSRSTLKLAEAFEVFVSPHDQKRLLREGMTAVDLGAAPGGWTWQFVSRGIKTYAIDNGPMKGVLWGHPLVEHLREDGFKFLPPEAVDWLVCDMVEQPFKVTQLMGFWLKNGHTHNAIFNLKLPMKKRFDEVLKCIDYLKKNLKNHTIKARHLYHDREEITLFVQKNNLKA